ncbi:hypothetical protein [Hymenobacter sediminicola]|uniref:Uncharacterized protein n=1 Tax=Hymenobacter sediminicola TaxID=2761579 RepID=A0A7G7W2X7_9BACT|nr:hypothetical protein [Hymenobacter sediminicola]QNH60720.1 hypothetical protein H4317_11005 [Hymenobacter sediminicola]
MSTLQIPLPDLDQKIEQAIKQAVEARILQLPPPDPWLTLTEAAAYANMCLEHMTVLVKGKPYRAATADKPERPAIKPKIPHGDTGFSRGLRVLQSEVDKYLMRHAYKNKAA